jgi:protoporphyrinogen oxidase
MTRQPIAIVGGGLAGLGCALALGEAGSRFQLFEAESSLGGLARSETRDGFTFDLAGHWLHVRDKAIRRLLENLLGADLVEFERSSWIYMRQRWIPYPFQANLWALPGDERDECIDGFERARRLVDNGAEHGPPVDFHDAVVRTWGDGIARHFLVPYNEKLWGLSLKELAPDWAGRFLPAPSTDQIVRGAGGHGAAIGYNVRLLYPRHGGIGVVAARLGDRLNGCVSLHSRVAALDVRGRRLQLADGREVGYDRLVATVPLPTLIGLCAEVPDEIKAAARSLRAVSVSCVNIAVRGPAPRGVPNCHWVYFPETRFRFYRVGCGAAAITSLAPEGCRSFSVEFSGCAADAHQLESHALSGLQECGLIHARDEVLLTFIRTIGCAYVVCDRSWQSNRQVALDWLHSHHVHSIGRYGGWQYGSMEDALLAGQQTADELIRRPGA